MTIENSLQVAMHSREFFMINFVICLLAFALNLFASVTLWNRRPLKPFQTILLNVVTLNALYALNEMSTALIFFTSSYHEIFNNKTFQSFRNLKASLIAHMICLFITFMTLQRLIAATKPFKYTTYVTNKSITLGSIIIYCFVGFVFITCSVLIWETNINSKKIDGTLSWLFIIESIFIIVCYIIIIYKIKSTKLSKSLVSSKQNKRMFKIAFILSVSFLLSYVPIALVLILQLCSVKIFQIVLIMVWIDSFINPITIVCDIYRLPSSAKGKLKRMFVNKLTPEIKIKEESDTSSNTS